MLRRTEFISYNEFCIRACIGPDARTSSSLTQIFVLTTPKATIATISTMKWGRFHSPAFARTHRMIVARSTCLQATARTCSSLAKVKTPFQSGFTVPPVGTKGSNRPRRPIRFRHRPVVSAPQRSVSDTENAHSCATSSYRPGISFRKYVHSLHYYSRFHGQCLTQYSYCNFTLFTPIDRIRKDEIDFIVIRDLWKS